MIARNASAWAIVDASLGEVPELLQSTGIAPTVPRQIAGQRERNRFSFDCGVGRSVACFALVSIAGVRRDFASARNSGSPRSAGGRGREVGAHDSAEQRTQIQCAPATEHGIELCLRLSLSLGGDA
jgi:hypothetical protein